MTPVIVTYVLMAGPALKQTAVIRGTTANVPMDFQGKIVSCKLIIRHLLFFNTWCVSYARWKIQWFLRNKLNVFLMQSNLYEDANRMYDSLKNSTQN